MRRESIHPAVLDAVRTSVEQAARPTTYSSVSNLGAETPLSFAEAPALGSTWLARSLNHFLSPTDVITELAAVILFNILMDIHDFNTRRFRQ